MPAYEFTLIIDGDVHAHADELYEAGLDDALLGTRDGISFVDITREAATLEAAVAEATLQIQRVAGLRVSRIEHPA